MLREKLSILIKSTRPGSCSQFFCDHDQGFSDHDRGFPTGQLLPIWGQTWARQNGSNYCEDGKFVIGKTSKVRRSRVCLLCWSIFFSTCSCSLVKTFFHLCNYWSRTYWPKILFTENWFSMNVYQLQHIGRTTFIEISKGVSLFLKNCFRWMCFDECV